jgi:hypothetical protein
MLAIRRILDELMSSRFAVTALQVVVDVTTNLVVGIFEAKAPFELDRIKSEFGHASFNFEEFPSIL